MEMFCIRSRYFAFELCQFIIYPPSLEEGGAEGNPGAGLHSAPFQHPYTRKSTTTPSGVHSMFAGLPIVKTFHLPHNPSHISIRHICHELSTHRHSLPSDVDFTGCILTLPTRFGLCPFEPSLPSCVISAHDARHHLASGRTSRNPAVRFPRTTPGHHTALGRRNRSL